jgi:hypothetical protein
MDAMKLRLKYVSERKGKASYRSRDGDLRLAACLNIKHQNRATILPWESLGAKERYMLYGYSY